MPAKNKHSLDDKIDYLTDLVHQLIHTIKESNQRLQETIPTKDGLIEINQLKYFLGFDDVRSVKKWLNQQNITMLLMGKKSYIKLESLDRFIELKSPSTNGHPVNRLDNSASHRGKSSLKENQPRSKAAINFLKSIHSD